ncbi:MAG: SufD family Fe-S cluster assembly protein [Hyphomonadaceae bacterium]|nr:SufD family Fe-S cluster assembly protein [Hyphomonadaceae bacterium]
MTQHAHLPSRRDEAWRWSDLRAAVHEVGVPEVAPVGDGHIADRLMRGVGTEPVTETFASGSDEVRSEVIALSDGFSWLSRTLVLEPGARVTRIVRQTAKGAADRAGVGAHLTRVYVGEGASFRQFILAEGAKLARIETHVSIEGEDAHVELNGAYLAAAGRHADLTSIITHKAPGATTRQLIKGVAAKDGRGVFQGKIVVERAAQRTDARQYHHGMLLEAGAAVFAKPELMIYADDVQCAHGNTAGGLDETAMFYLRSRGVPEREARGLLIEAFVAGAIPEGLPADVDADLRGRIHAWLEANA